MSVLLLLLDAGWILLVLLLLSGDSLLCSREPIPINLGIVGLNAVGDFEVVVEGIDSVGTVLVEGIEMIGTVGVATTGAAVELALLSLSGGTGEVFAGNTRVGIVGVAEGMEGVGIFKVGTFREVSEGELDSVLGLGLITIASLATLSESGRGLSGAETLEGETAASE